jgi:hypothetical protein
MDTHKPGEARCTYRIYMKGTIAQTTYQFNKSSAVTVASSTYKDTSEANMYKSWDVPGQ